MISAKVILASQVLTLVAGVEPTLEITRYVKKPDFPNQTETLRAVIVKDVAETPTDLTDNSHELKIQGIL